MNPEDLVPTTTEKGSTITPTEDGGAEVELPSEDENETSDQENAESGSEFSEENHLENLAEKLSDEDLNELGIRIKESFQADLNSNQDHFDTLTKGFDMLGSKIKEGTLFQGACGAFHPLIMESAVKFQQKASIELLPSGGPVKVEVIGDVTPQAEQQASRVSDHMNWQCTVQIPEYYSDKERMLFYLPLVGSAITKSFYKMRLKRPDSTFIPIDRFIVPYGCTSLEKAPRYTEIIPITKSDLQKETVAGLYREVELAEPEIVKPTAFQSKQDEFIGIKPTNNKEDAVYELLEQHVEISLEDVDDDVDVDKPYIITVEKETGKVLSIYRNWEYGDSTFTKILHYTHYPFVPGIGFYGLGYIHLLGNTQLTLTTALRALIDAGQFANFPAGFKKKGIRMGKEQGPLKPGEMRDIEVLGDDIEKSFAMLPFKGPDQTLFALLQYLEQRGFQFADSTEQVVQDSSNYGPVGTTMALLDASTKFFTAVHKRLHFAQQKELRILARLNRDYLEEKFSYNVPGQTLVVYKADYSDKVSIEPVSDPNISSAAQRFALAQAKLAFVQGLPPAMQSTINTQPIIASALTSLGEKHLDQIFQAPQQAQPLDPLSDIANVVKGVPIKAFPGQDHDSHISFKQTWLQDPSQGANPMYQMFIPPIQANIREHMLEKYQEQLGGLVQPILQGMDQAGTAGAGTAGQAGPQVTGAATDPQTLAKVLAMAATEVQKANQNTQSNQMMNTPEGMLAQAELMKAQAAVSKVQQEGVTSAAKIANEKDKIDLEASKELNRKQETQQELESQAQGKQLEVGSKLIQGAAKNTTDFAREKVKERTAKFMADNKPKHQQQ